MDKRNSMNILIFSVRIMNDVCLFQAQKIENMNVHVLFHHFDVIFLPFFRWHISITNFEQFIFHKGKLPFKSIRSKSSITIIINRRSENMYIHTFRHVPRSKNLGGAHSNAARRLPAAPSDLPKSGGAREFCGKARVRNGEQAF